MPLCPRFDDGSDVPDGQCVLTGQLENWAAVCGLLAQLEGSAGPARSSPCRVIDGRRAQAERLPSTEIIRVREIAST
jgi:hypothetical protein